MCYTLSMSTAQASPNLCQATRKDGTACQASAVRNGRCIGHQGADNAAWRRRGGHGRSNSSRALKAMPARLVPILDQLVASFNAACAGTLESPQAGLIAPIARAIVAVCQAGEQELLLRAVQQKAYDDGKLKDRYGHPNRNGAPLPWPSLDA
jgi:hypothetical protein